MAKAPRYEEKRGKKGSEEAKERIMKRLENKRLKHIKLMEAAERERKRKQARRQDWESTKKRLKQL